MVLVMRRCAVMRMQKRKHRTMIQLICVWQRLERFLLISFMRPTQSLLKSGRSAWKGEYFEKSIWHLSETLSQVLTSFLFPAFERLWQTMYP